MTEKARISQRILTLDKNIAAVALEMAKKNLTKQEYNKLQSREKLLHTELNICWQTIEALDDDEGMPELEPVESEGKIVDLEPSAPIIDLTQDVEVPLTDEQKKFVIEEKRNERARRRAALEDNSEYDADPSDLFFSVETPECLQTPGLLSLRNSMWCAARLQYPVENNPRTWRTVIVNRRFQLLAQTQAGNTKEYFYCPINVFLDFKLKCRPLRSALVPKFVMDEELPATLDTGWVQHGPAHIYEPLVDNVAGSLYGLIKRKELKDVDRAAASLVDSVSDTWAKPAKEGGKDIVCVHNFIERAETAAAAIERSHQILAKIRDAVQSSTDFVVDDTKFGVSYTTARDRTKKYLSQYAIRRGFCTRFNLLLTTGRWFPRYEVPLSSHQLAPLWKTRLDSWLDKTSSMSQNQSEGFDRIVDTLNMNTPLIPSVRPFQSPPPTYQHKPIQEP